MNLQGSGENDCFRVVST